MSTDYSHEHLMTHFKAIGYFLPGPGICAGLAQMSIEAFLLGSKEFARFNEWLDLIAKTAPEALNQRIKNARKAIAERSRQVPGFVRLTEDEKILTEIAGFFDGVELYLHPDRHKEIFAHAVAQPQVQSIFSSVEDEGLPVEKVIVIVDSFPGIYKRFSLHDFFTKLNDIIQHYQPSCDFALGLDSINHRISLCYDSKKKVWVLIDANQLPTKEVDSNQLSVEIFNALASNVHEGSFPYIAAFNTTMYCTEKNKPVLQALMQTASQSQEYKAAHDITIEKIDMRTDRLKVSLAQIAAKYEHLNVLNTINAIKPSALNEKGHVGRTAMHVAAQLNLIKVIKVLAEAGVVLNALDSEDHTPMYLAIQNNNIEAVEVLLDLDPSLVSAGVNRSGCLPIDFARKKNHSEMINLLLQRKTDATKKSQTVKPTMQQEQARQQADAMRIEAERLKKEQARQQAEAMKQQISDQRSEQLEPIKTLLASLKEQADALRERDKWVAQEILESIHNEMKKCNDSYIRGQCTLLQ